MRLKSLPTFLVFISALACTTYHEAGPSGGFSETRLNDATFEIRVQGNGYTSADRVSQFLLRRAAEVTLEHGHRYFEIVEQRANAPSSMGFILYTSAATVRLFFGPNKTPKTADALVVFRETEAIAKGRLFDRART